MKKLNALVVSLALLTVAAFTSCAQLNERAQVSFSIDTAQLARNLSLDPNEGSTDLWIVATMEGTSGTTETKAVHNAKVTTQNPQQTAGSVSAEYTEITFDNFLVGDTVTAYVDVYYIPSSASQNVQNYWRYTGTSDRTYLDLWENKISMTLNEVSPEDVESIEGLPLNFSTCTYKGESLSIRDGENKTLAFYSNNTYTISIDDSPISQGKWSCKTYSYAPDSSDNLVADGREIALTEYWYLDPRIDTEDTPDFKYLTFGGSTPVIVMPRKTQTVIFTKTDPESVILSGSVKSGSGITFYITQES